MMLTKQHLIVVRLQVLSGLDTLGGIQSELYRTSEVRLFDLSAPGGRQKATTRRPYPRMLLIGRVSYGASGTPRRRVSAASRPISAGIVSEVEGSGTSWSS